MANLIARMLEKRMAHLFENFQAGKNVTSSLLKGEGTATDLQINRNYINDLLPMGYVVEQATCKLLKWQFSIRSLGKGPIVITLTGVNVTVQQLHPSQMKAQKPRKKKPSKAKNKSRRNAILQGIKVQMVDLHLRVQLQHTSEHPIPGAHLPYMQLAFQSIRVHSTNSQWFEVDDLSKVHVINSASNEALSFRKLEVSGCSLKLYDSSQIPFNSNRDVAMRECLVWEGVCLQGRFSTKRRAADWKLLAFKIDLELQEMKVQLSRRELFMIRNFIHALLSHKKAEKALIAHHRNLSTSSMASDPDEDEGDEAELDETAEALDSILENQKSSWTDNDAKWCSHIDSSINLYYKQLDFEVHETEDDSSPGFVILLTALKAHLWPAQGFLVKNNGRVEHSAEISARLFTIKEMNPISDKLPAHLSIFKPASDMEVGPDMTAQHIFSLSIQLHPVPKNSEKNAPPPNTGKNQGAQIGVPRIKLVLAPIIAVVDSVVWLRLIRLIRGGALERSGQMEGKGKSTKTNDSSKKEKEHRVPAVTVELDHVSILLPVYNQRKPTADDSGLEINEMRADLGPIVLQSKPSSRHDWKLSDGIFGPSTVSFPHWQGDFVAPNFAQSFKSTVDAFEGRISSISVTFSLDGEDEAKQIVSVDSFKFGMATNRRWESGQSPANFPRIEAWLDIEQGPQIEWGLKELVHVMKAWDIFNYGPEAQALRQEEEQARQMVQALEAARTGASQFTQKKVAKGGKSTRSNGFKVAAGIRMSNLKIKFMGENYDVVSMGSSKTDMMIELYTSQMVFKLEAEGFSISIDRTRRMDSSRPKNQKLVVRIERRGTERKLKLGPNSLAAHLFVLVLENVNIRVNPITLKALKSSLVAEMKKREKHKHKGVIKSKGYSKKLKEEANEMKQTILAGLHAMVDFHNCHVNFAGVAPSLGAMPLTVESLIVHNRVPSTNHDAAAQEEPSLATEFGSPLSICVRSRKYDPKRSTPALDEVARARRSEQAVMSVLEGLESKFAMGPLATVEAAVQSHPEDFILGVTRAQMEQYLDELQKARGAIAGCFSGQDPARLNSEVSESLNHVDSSQRRKQKPESVVKDLRQSISAAKSGLRDLLKNIENGLEPDDPSPSKPHRLEFEVSEAQGLGMDASEMMELFNTFCVDGALELEYEALLGADGTRDKQ